MLDVNNVLPTPFKVKKMKNLTSIYTSDDFRSKKNSRKKKVNFQNNVLVPKTNESREGATVAATPYLFSAGRATAFVFQAGPAAFSIESLLYRKHSLNTANVLPSTRIETPAIFRHLIDSPKQMIQMKLIRCR